MKTDNKILAKSLRILARDIQSDDGVANSAIEEAAERIEQIEYDVKQSNDLIAAQANKINELKQCIDAAIEMINDGDDIFDLDLDMCCDGLLSAIAQDIGFYHRTVPEIIKNHEQGKWVKFDPDDKSTYPEEYRVVM